MAGTNPNRNARRDRQTDDDDDDDEPTDIYDNDDTHTIQEEEFLSFTEYNENRNWNAADNNLNQPAYDVLTQLSPCDETHTYTKSDEATNPVGGNNQSEAEQSDVYNSINDYQPKEAANYDVTVAQTSIDIAIEKYELNQFAHDTEPKSDFSLVSLGMLNPTFNVLDKREKDAMFELLSRLKLAMGNALSACLHAALFEKLSNLICYGQT